jgi:Protein of unknown function (DUF3618)
VTEATGTGPDRPSVPDDPAALHADIEETRAQLSDTVDEIGQRLDVSARAKESASEARIRMSETASGVGNRLRAFGRDRPAVAAGAAAIAAAGVLYWIWRG